MAASLAVVVAGGAVAYDQLAGRVATGRSEVRRIALEDGSIVTLNGHSAVQIRYADDIRRVVLRRGEASFEVAHNRERHFVVRASGAKVRAVGPESAGGLEG